ncbi:Metallo-peptidase family M12B Reprolysin-like-domain-containing protein [Hyaloraphidium curvatum]|nr:Metallo-peptidase family M12B Reprolysin-like-domain-containing protein [Hyaloraphidium curvatum]
MKAALLALAALALAAPAHSAPAAGRGPPLFAPSGGPPAGSGTVHPFAARGRYVVLAPGLLDNAPERVRLNLFDDVDLEAVKDYAKDPEDDDDVAALFGRVDGEVLSSVVLTTRTGNAAGTVRTHDKVYEIEPVHGAVHVVWEIDPAKFPAEGQPRLSPFQRPQGPPSTPPGHMAKRQSPVIDVMVVYTPQARIDAGGLAAIQAAISLAVTESNDAYASSGVAQRLRLVYTMEAANYVSGGSDADLRRVTDPSDGFLDDVPLLRNAYGADVVSFWNTDSAMCGLGWLNTDLAISSAYGYSVVSRTCATGYFSFSHEIGHNQGLSHDRANSVGATPVAPYAYGYQEPSGLFRTVMAYMCPSGACPRIKMFSNPLASYNGAPAGVPSTLSTAADNAQAMNQGAAMVAGWRQAVVTQARTTTRKPVATTKAKAAATTRRK